MRPTLRAGIGCAVSLVLAVVAGAQAPSGHWEGRIDVPGSPLEIAIDLGRDSEGRWIGKIDIPVQGLRDFPLRGIQVDGTSVSFVMPGIPGDPVFQGALADDGAVLAGELSQSGGTMPFRVERTGDAEIVAAPKPEVPEELAADLVGRWEGTLEAPGRSLRIAFVLATERGGEVAATFDSPDEGRTGMPVSRVFVDGELVRLELSYAGAAYEGTLNEDRTKLTGAWQQGGGSLDLVLRKAAATSTAEIPGGTASAALPARALELLARHIEGLVESEEIVGGEIHVIKNRRTVLREAFGWQDREAGVPLEIDAVFCVRSMTKPLVGTAIQMLIDDGRLRLQTPVHEILPFFASPQMEKITVEHLLTHTGGFPFTTLKKPLSEYGSLADVAVEAAATELLFEPGSRFEYSDAGSDTLGAIVAAITGEPVERFLQRRIFEPLGMQETFPLLGDDDALIERIPSAYSGGTGSWSKHWQPSDPPIFPMFLTSQSLYSTTADYARLLALWMDGGKVGDRRLLSADAVERALAPGRAMSNYPQPAADLEVYYGQQWMVYAATAVDGSPRRVFFGHNGSDGTHAWAWPEEDLMVLFFTQSRGTTAGVALEPMLQTLLVDQALDDPSLSTRVPDADELEQVTGLYWDETAEHAYYVISAHGNGLTLERPGKMHLVFKAGPKPGHFVHEANSQVRIEFVRSEEGAVTAMRTFFGTEIELDPRHRPQQDLPSVEQVISLVGGAHHVDRLSALGVVRLSGTVEIPNRQLEGTFSTLFDPTRSRDEMLLGTNQEVVVRRDSRVWTYATGAGVDELEGERLEQALLESVSVRYGDWTEHYEHVEVLERLEQGEQSVLLVRVVPRNAPGATIVVDEATGRVRHIDSLQKVPGLGIVGIETDFSDFRDVGGMLLPFHSVSEYATKLIGRVVTTVTAAETGVEVSEESFALPGNDG